MKVFIINPLDHIDPGMAYALLPLGDASHAAATPVHLFTEEEHHLNNVIEEKLLGAVEACIGPDDKDLQDIWAYLKVKRSKDT